MKPKFKLGDRIRYIGKKRRGYPIPSREYNINSDAIYRPATEYHSIFSKVELGDYAYSLIPASENNDENKYLCVEEKYLILVNPSKIIFG